jgi:cobalt-zinc-cadmium efflux system outer membrane protein
MYRWCIGSLVAASLCITGCQSHPLFDDSSLPTTLTASHNTKPVEEKPNATPLPTGTLTLAQSLALAMEHDPSLQVGRLKIQSAQIQGKYAGILPNPELEIELENFAGSGDFAGTQALETTISLAQSFPLGGDLAHMKRVAGKASELADWDQQAQRVELLSTVTRQYVQALVNQQRVKQNQQALALADSVHDLIQKRVNAGVAPQVQLMRSDVQRAQVQLQLKQAQRQLTASFQQLALSWGQQEVTFDNLDGKLDQLTNLPSIDSLFTHIQQHPAIKRWASELTMRQAQQQLASAIATQDLTVRLGIKHDNDNNDQALILGLSMPLPIHDRNQANRLTSRIGQQSVEHEKRQALQAMQQTLVEAYTQLAIAHDQAIALRDQALPKATQAFDVTQKAYEQGDVQFIDVLDAEQTLNELQGQYLDALANWHLARAWIEGMICQPLDQLLNSQTTTGE